MLSENAQNMKLPDGFRYMGFDVPGIELSEALNYYFGTVEPAYHLSKSVPLSWKVGLYMVGRDLEMESEEAEALRSPVKKAGRMVYSDSQKRNAKGTWHKDGVLFLPRSEKPKGMWPMPDDYALAKYFIGIKGFIKKDYLWQIDPLPDTKEEYIWLPPQGIIAPSDTSKFAYNPVTGTPDFTVETKHEAIERWKKTGLSEDQAEREISNFYRSDSGTLAVCSESYVENGPLCVVLVHRPGFWALP